MNYSRLVAGEYARGLRILPKKIGYEKVIRDTWVQYLLKQNSKCPKIQSIPINMYVEVFASMPPL